MTGESFLAVGAVASLIKGGDSATVVVNDGVPATIWTQSEDT
jgi:hypothetical protein